MISKILPVAIMTFMSFIIQAQNKLYVQTATDTMENKSYDIKELIKLKDSVKMQQTMLIEFMNKNQIDDHISVVEFQNYFELTVVHPAAKGFTGGAECYKLDKNTKELEMIWHEHPMELLELEHDKKKKRK